MRTRTNPVFYADQLRLLLADEPERVERMLHDPDSVDLLTWNVFSSLDTHSDRNFLAYRLQSLGGSAVRAPVRLSLWTGRRREPLLEPSGGYLATVRERIAAVGGDPASLAPFEAPTEVPVRIETPDVLVLVDTVGETPARGAGGRDRVVELVDAGLEHARRLSKELAVAVVYRSGSDAAAELSARLRQLRDPAVLARELPHRPASSAVVLRELPWQQLAQVWQQEVPFLHLGGQPAKAFADHLRARGLL